MEDKNKNPTLLNSYLEFARVGRGRKKPFQGEIEEETPSRAADSLWQGPLWNLARQDKKNPKQLMPKVPWSAALS